MIKQDNTENKQPVTDQAYLFTLLARAGGPFTQAMITGGFIGIFAFILMAKFRWFSTVDTFFYTAMVYLVVAMMTWLYLLRHWLGLTAERVTKLDLNGDGVIGKPTETRHTVTVAVHNIEQGHVQVDYARFTISDERMHALAVGLLNGMPLNEKAWCGKGKLFSDKEFAEIRDEMIRRRMAIWRNPTARRQGCELTKSGWAAMQKIGGKPPTEVIDSEMA